MDPATLQQNLSRAFIQSAVAQNMQMQQQLMAQNQALQQLLNTVIVCEITWFQHRHSSTDPSNTVQFSGDDWYLVTMFMF